MSSDQTETGNTVETPKTMPGKNGGTLMRGGKHKAAYKKAFDDKIKAAVPGVAEELVKIALRGNLRAIQLVLEHGVGKPKDTVEVIDVAAIARRVAAEEGIDPDVLIREAQRLAADDVE